MASSKPTSTTPKYTLTDSLGHSTTSNDGTFSISAAGTYTAGNGGETINVTGNSTITVFTNNAGDTIDGHLGSGNYTFNGGNGKDFLLGGSGADNLYGGNGADSVSGGAGADNITGGNGGDFLTGGSGNDIFHYGSYLESTYQFGGPITANVNTLGTAPFDVITDFNNSGVDKLDLQALNSQLTGSGPTELVWYGVQGSDANAGTAHGGLAHGLWTDTTGSFLYADVSGDGKADLKIQVSNVDGNSFTGGVDHLPVIGTGTFSGTVNELADATGSSATDSVTPPTTINFTDPDTTDTHTASFVADASNTTSYGTFSLDPVSESGGTGSVDWHYGVTDSAIDFLGQGETVVQKYDVSITDNWGASATQVVTVTITGANDAAAISVGAGDADTGGVTEDANSGGVGTEVANGTLSFGDVDLSDSHTVDIGPNGNLGTLNVSVDTDTTGSGTGGVISWDYSVDDGNINYLGQGETKTETFSVVLTEHNFDDSFTHDVTHDVTITVTGTNDDAVIADYTGSEDGHTDGTIIDAGGPEANESDPWVTNGTLAFTDADIHDTHTAVVESGGSHYGTLTASADDSTGLISWHYEIADSAIDGLTDATDTFTIDLNEYSVVDSSTIVNTVTQTVTIHLTGDIDGPESDSDTSHDYDTVQSVIDAGFLTQGQVDTANVIPNGGSQTFTGSSGNDVVIGNDNANTLNLQNGNDAGLGLAGSDTINGSNGNDLLFGQAGNDSLAGGNDSDVIYGGSGNDTINGSGGQDQLWGGSGNDTFVFTATADSAPATRDTIADFHPGFDTIDVSAIDANTNLAGPQSFATGGATIGSSALANGVWATVSGSDTVLHFDTNGVTGTEEMQIVLANFTGTLHASDFIV